MRKLLSSRTHIVVLIVIVFIASFTTYSSLIFFGVKEPNEWNSNFFLSIGTGLYGAAITFFLIDFLLKQKEKLDEEKIRRVTITSNVLSDFQSKEMLDCRIKSDKVFKDKLSITNLSDTSSLYYHLTEDLDCYDEWLSVSRLLHFWEHVAKLDKSELLDEELFKISLLPYLKGLYEGHDFKGFIDRSLNTHWADPVKELSKKYRVYL